jgi:hypothetical protein
MGLPPAHRIDHTPRIVLSFDTAWDVPKIEAELETIGKRGDHPWVRYCTYQARGDLATVKQYLLSDPPSAPLVFELRRLTLREMTIVENRELTSAPAARNLALSYALLDVEGCDLKFDRGGRDLPAALSDADLDALRAIVGDAGLRELGNHSIACSRMELSDPEKKP